MSWFAGSTSFSLFTLISTTHTRLESLDNAGYMGHLEILHFYVEPPRCIDWLENSCQRDIFQFEDLQQLLRF